EELEALRSIFPDEFEPLSETSFKLRLILDPDALPPPPNPDSESDPTPPPSLSLAITYVTNYPDTSPEIELTDASGFTDSELASLQAELESVAADSVGMAMGFALASAGKEGAERILTERAARIAAEEERRREEEEEIERARFVGNKVTGESFDGWKIRFLAEIAGLIKRGEKLPPAMHAAASVAGMLQATGKGGKLTGRQLFEKDRSLAKSDMTFMEDGDVAVDLELFEGMEGLDADDEEENAVLANFRDEE
ncbi:hypothetical protein BDK51DRAFT_5479, partial [Blyttiomyces helicus]